MQTAKSMSFQLSDLGTAIGGAFATVIAIGTGYLGAKHKLRNDKSESADANAKLDGIEIYKAMVADRDITIEKLQERNEELYKKNMELFNSNQAALSKLGTLELEVKELQRQIKELKEIGERRKDAD